MGAFSCCLHSQLELSLSCGKQADNLGASFTALNVGLFHGFSIARFAEVLVDSGYAQSAETSWDRYSNTAWHIR